MRIHCLLAVVVLFCSGCATFNGPSLAGLSMPEMDVPTFDFERMEFRSQSPKKEDDFETKVDTRFIGKYTTVSGLNMVVLEGVGLVVGLNGTGGDPPPSGYRKQLLKEMRQRKIANPNQILRSPNTAMVIVRAYLPPMVQKKQRFDIQVRLPGGSEATSLNGGYLLETYLSERAHVAGKGLMKGHIFAKGAGPILISATEDKDESLAGLMRRGKILGGGYSMKERDLYLDLRSDFRGSRNVMRIAKRIGERFYSYNKHGLRQPLAEAKTDQRIVLKVHPRYRDNYPRYLQVIRNIDFRETPLKRRVRIQKLKHELMKPVTCATAAMRLESIGQVSVPVLKEGLKSDSPEVRFYSALSLAYLDEPDGLKELATAAKKEPAFRIFALAAMATVDDSETHALLRELMNETSAETRYGALRALSTLDKRDPFIRGEALNKQFMLHVLNTSGPPMVHLTLRKKAEIVLFGADQRFKTPLMLRAGRHILVTAAPRTNKVTVSRFQAGKADQRKVVSTRIADVIRTVAEFGASYPEVAQMLSDADRSRSLPGNIAIDALPEAGRVYYRGRPSMNAKANRGNETRVGNRAFTPNLFSGAGLKANEEEGESGLGDDGWADNNPDSASSSDDSDKRKSKRQKMTDKMPWYDPRGLFEWMKPKWEE